MDPRNEAVLRHLEVERVAPPDTNTAWVIDGYSLSTHPDLCDRVREVNGSADEPAEFRYLYGKPALVAESSAIVAFGGGGGRAQATRRADPAGGGADPSGLRAIVQRCA